MSFGSIPRGLVLIAAPLGLALIAIPRPVCAAAEPQWYPLNPSAPPGTPPAVVLQASSNPHQTVLEVTLNGFYYETLVVGSQTFRRLSFDRLHREASYSTLGRPELPALHHLLGDLVGAQMGPPVVQVLDQVTIPGAVIYPVQRSTREGEPAPPFVWDQTFYQQTGTPYPAARAAALGGFGSFAGVDLLGAETYPIRAVPATQTLFAARRFVVTFPHPGAAPITGFATRRQARMHASLLDNAPIVAGFRPPFELGMLGDYLFVTPLGFADAIEPLANQKRRRGYTVTVATIEDIGANCEDLQGYIAGWYAGGAVGRDRYVLLVGTPSHVPLCRDPYLRQDSDLVNGCLTGMRRGRADPFPEVYIGRLPCDDAAECADMVEKTLTYEAGYPGTGEWLGNVLLTAHAGGALTDYEGNQDEVRFFADYAVPPTFDTLYGSEGATNAAVEDAVEAGRGVLGYRGHGVVDAWSGWNGGDFAAADVEAITNGERTPVVFSISCFNNSIGFGTLSIGEIWMKTTERAVAHYSATDFSWFEGNQTLNPELFQAIYRDDLCILGDAIAAAQAEMYWSHDGEVEGVYKGEENCWMYLLLGDPELQVWREPPPQLVVLADVEEVPIGPGVVTLAVHGQGRSGSEPIAFAVVALHKDGEFTENRYTDANGVAVVPIDPATPGTIHVTVYTEFDTYGAAIDSIAVAPASAVAETGAVGPASLTIVPVGPSGDGVGLRAYLQVPAYELVLRLVDPNGRVRARRTYHALDAGEHRLDLLPVAGRLARGVYWIEARSFSTASTRVPERARARWVALR